MRQASREWGESAVIAGRLRERRVEIEQAALARVYAVSEPPSTGGPEYAEGLRAALSAAFDYSVEGITRGEQSAQPIPDALLVQARLAARSGVSLDTVLRRYFVGYTLLEDFLVQEAEPEIGPAALKCLLRAQAAAFDRMLAAVSKAYTMEVERRPKSTERRKADLVERLLAAEPIDASGLGYELEGHHLGIVASGPDARETIQALVKDLDCQVFALSHEEGTLWAWLGARRKIDPRELKFSREVPDGLFVAIGEPGAGLPGWRLTHRQARAALSVALRKGESWVRYRDVALAASMLRDDLLVTSLRALYLTPLEADLADSEMLVATLRAYFAHDLNVSSSAVALGVSRRTVARRLQKAEELLEKPLRGLDMNFEAALRLHELDATSAHRDESHTGTPGR